MLKILIILLLVVLVTRFCIDGVDRTRHCHRHELENLSYQFMTPSLSNIIPSLNTLFQGLTGSVTTMCYYLWISQT